MPAPNECGVNQREVNDERKTISCDGGGGALREGELEAERWDTGRA
jgi:hypothetical protein